MDWCQQLKNICSVCGKGKASRCLLSGVRRHTRAQLTYAWCVTQQQELVAAGDAGQRRLCKRKHVLSNLRVWKRARHRVKTLARKVKPSLPANLHARVCVSTFAFKKREAPPDAWAFSKLDLIMYVQNLYYVQVDVACYQAAAKKQLKATWA